MSLWKKPEKFWGNSFIYTNFIIPADHFGACKKALEAPDR
jgi:hypothetical protein